ncbi:scarecrow-like protein 1 [Amaranthus tricolor]|uniref:scarecrow-like protein 1 n=1 Tax=Amaranthus tricolor TaxID=29722 RepID=UPI00259037E1|nr:scarecrow-like protein 1 [Amaranthus tricolor]XP_057532564.1 scarecrow-like protein 1 [Amaranthus tricolor]XP_057532565.1 scarecrow-like protein 1 [Amaranthus tricolor]XP_057532566.1 scarecrow-like protein 1 [Amaranthus tricolor]
MSTTYGSPRLCALQGGNNSSGLSNQLYGSEKHKIKYATESFSSPSYCYDPKFFVNSPSGELINPPNAAGNQCDSSCATNYELEYFISQSPEAVEYDEVMVKLKLQELEHALLDEEEDGVDEVVMGPDTSMEIDVDWAGSLRNMMDHDSPKESTSSESSNLSSISNKDESLPLRSTKELLFDCAAIISEGDFEEAALRINKLRQMVSIQGEPLQRIAAYMVEGLAARLASSGKVLYKALRCKEPPSFEKLAAMQVLFEVCPCFKFGFMAANEAIMEAIKYDKKVHIIDFDINQGNQYINLIRSLAKQHGKSIQVRLTGVDDPESVQRPIGGLKNIGQRLEALAEINELQFEFKAIPSRTPLVTPEMLDCRAGEALVVNFAFLLHHLPDESVSTVNIRDQLLRMIKSLNPKLVTVVEQDVNTNTTPFLSRFSEVYSYYSAVFESLDATLPRESQERINVEKQCLARDIVNIIACEGEERIERYEVAGKWRARMQMAGFRSCPLKQNVNEMIRELIVSQYCNKYKLDVMMDALHFGWEDKSLVVASAWK